MPSRFQDPRSRSPGWWRLGLALVIAGQAMLLSLGLNTTDEAPHFGSRWYVVLHGVLMLSACVTLLLLGGPLFSNFFQALKEKKITIEALFVVSLLGALIVSLQSTLTGLGPLYYEVVSIVLVIYTFGNSLRSRAFDEARQILSRAQASYATAWQEKAGARVRTPVDQLRVDDRVIIPPGEMSTVDGVIVEGRAFVNLASVSGEPSAVAVKPGDHLPAGAWTLDGLLVVRVTSTARSIDAVFRQLTTGAPSAYEQLADRVTRWFLPVVGGVAVITFAAWSAWDSVPMGITAAMSVLLVACPCAIGMATPLAIQTFLFRLSNYGWHARSGELVERLAHIDTVFFDKTGTLTLSDLKISQAAWNPHAGFSSQQLQGLVSLAEQHVSQPIARAFHIWEPLPGAVLKELRVHPGEGISAEVFFQEKLHALKIGQKSFVEKDSSGIWPAQAQAKRQVWITLNNSRAGIVALVESPRPQLHALLAKLQAENLRVEILTGDPDPQINFSVPVHPGLSPEAKAQRVREAQSSGARVLFVGDGLNDALAMRQASCSLAVEEGAPLSHAAATAVIKGEGMEALLSALKLSQKATATLRWNLQFAAFYNFVGISLAALGVLHPVVASLLMLVSSVIVAWRAAVASQAS